MMQHQVLQTVSKEKALGVVVDTGMQRQIQHHNTQPKQPLARSRNTMHAGTTDEQHNAHHKHEHQRGRKLPGHKPA